MLTPSDSGGLAGLPPSMVGAVIAGKYRLRRLIGHGGMGSVYKAENVGIGRMVALKILHAHLADDGTTLARFQREARLAASAGHDHVVEIFDMGVEPSGAPYIVMEYVRGQSLERTLREAELSVSRAVRIAGDILSALNAVHARGIVHRDLKPANVLLTTRGGRTDFVKLHDFGISTFEEAILDPQGPNDLTPSGRTMGTPHYASPEQIQGAKGRDARVDIYAVGVMLYEMLAGHRPFTKASFPELCRAIVREDPPPLAAFRKDVPEVLEAAVLRALSKDPAARFTTAAEMRRALIPFGAEPLPDEPEPTDTFTWDMRELAAREEEHRSKGAGEELAPGAPESILGAALIVLVRFARSRLGGARFVRLAHECGAESARIALGTIDADTWYPLASLEVLTRLDREYGAGDRRLVADAGRALARDFVGRGAPSAMVRTVTPELFFAMAAEFYRRFFTGGIPAVARASRGHGRLEIRDPGAPSLERAVLVVGLIEEALRLAGARDVDVRLVQAAGLGEGADVIEATWG